MVKVRSAIVIILCITLLFALPVNAVDFADAAASVYLLNNGRPFMTSGNHIWNDGSNAPANVTYKGTKYTFTSRSFNPPSNHLLFACNKLSSTIYLIPGYVYTVKFSMQSQFFDDNDNRINPQNMSVLFAYEVGDGTFAMARTTALPVSVKANSMDGYDVEVSFTISSPGAQSNLNFVDGVSVTGCYQYNFLYLNLGSVYSGVTGPVSAMYSIDNFSVVVDNTDAYNAVVINNLPGAIADDLLQKEHDEAESGANSAVSDLTGAISDNSGGFIDAMGSLVSALSYTGTESAWTLPAISLPELPGVMDSYQLTSEQPIDFSVWVERMPDTLLQLVRALTTIALIIYCFKELWSTFSYVFTLKGGGSDG